MPKKTTTRRKHVRKTKRGRSIVRKHPLRINTIRKSQAKRDMIGYRRTKTRQRKRWTTRDPTVNNMSQLDVNSGNSDIGNNTGVVNSTKNYIEIMGIHNDEPVKKVDVEKLGAVKMISIEEADDDKIVIMDSTESKDPTDHEFH